MSPSRSGECDIATAFLRLLILYLSTRIVIARLHHRRGIAGLKLRNRASVAITRLCERRHVVRTLLAYSGCITVAILTYVSRVIESILHNGRDVAITLLVLI